MKQCIKSAPQTSVPWHTLWSFAHVNKHWLNLWKKESRNLFFSCVQSYAFYFLRAGSKTHCCKVRKESGPQHAFQNPSELSSLCVNLSLCLRNLFLIRCMVLWLLSLLGGVLGWSKNNKRASPKDLWLQWSRKTELLACRKS